MPFVDYGPSLVGFPDTAAFPSPSLWGTCPLDEGMFRMRHRICTDDFTDNAFEEDNTPVTHLARYDYAGDAAAGTGCILATDPNGVYRLSVTNTDNNEAYLQANRGLAGMCAIPTSNGTNRLWFEARVRPSLVTDGGLAVLLAEEGASAANLLTDNTMALADKDYLGFRCLAADSDGFDCVYNTAGGGGESVLLEAASQSLLNLTAAAWVKVGLFFDGEYINYFLNGVPVARVLRSATNVPDGEELAPTFAAKTGANTALTFDIDWYWLVQAKY